MLGTKSAPCYNVLTYTEFLIRERLLQLKKLALREKALPPSEYGSCRRSLLQAIEELKGVLRSNQPQTPSTLRRPPSSVTRECALPNTSLPAKKIFG